MEVSYEKTFCCNAQRCRGWGQHATCGKEKFCYRTALAKRTVALGRGVPRLHAHVVLTPFPTQNVPPKLSQIGHLVLSPNTKSWVGMHASPTPTWQPPHVLTWMHGESEKLQPHVVCTSFPKVFGPPKWYQTGHVNYLVVGTSHMPRLDIKGYKHVHTATTRHTCVSLCLMVRPTNLPWVAWPWQGTDHRGWFGWPITCVWPELLAAC